MHAISLREPGFNNGPLGLYKGNPCLLYFCLSSIGVSISDRARNTSILNIAGT